MHASPVTGGGHRPRFECARPSPVSSAQRCLVSTPLFGLLRGDGRAGPGTEWPCPPGGACVRAGSFCLRHAAPRPGRWRSATHAGTWVSCRLSEREQYTPVPAEEQLWAAAEKAEPRPRWPSARQTPWLPKEPRAQAGPLTDPQLRGPIRNVLVDGPDVTAAPRSVRTKLIHF